MNIKLNTLYNNAWMFKVKSATLGVTMGMAQNVMVEQATDKSYQVWEIHVMAAATQIDDWMQAIQYAPKDWAFIEGFTDYHVLDSGIHHTELVTTAVGEDYYNDIIRVVVFNDDICGADEIEDEEDDAYGASNWETLGEIPCPPIDWETYIDTEGIVNVQGSILFVHDARFDDHKAWVDREAIKWLIDHKIMDIGQIIVAGSRSHVELIGSDMRGDPHQIGYAGIYVRDVYDSVSDPDTDYVGVCTFHAYVKRTPSVVRARAKDGQERKLILLGYARTKKTKRTSKQADIYEEGDNDFLGMRTLENLRAMTSNEEDE